MDNKKIEKIIVNNDKEKILNLIKEVEQHYKDFGLNSKISYIDNYEKFISSWKIEKSKDEKEEISEEFLNDIINKYFKITNNYSIGIVCVNPLVECNLQDLKEQEYFNNKIVVSNTVFNKITQDNFKRKLAENLKSTDSITKILELALQKEATDIFLEKKNDKVTLNFRIDNVVEEQNEILNAKEFDSISRTLQEDGGFNSEKIAKEIKGKISKIVLNQKIELRLSIVETVNGQSINLRILAQVNKNLTMANLGYYEKDIKVIKNIFNKKGGGLFFISGATGSGKTTLLNTALLEYYYEQKEKKQGKRIMTIEDPVEIQIDPEFTQINVKNDGEEEYRRDWEDVIAQCLRQNPDILLVGETRTLKTIKASVNAAQSGHFTLTTFHSSSVYLTLQRIKNFGFDLTNLNELLVGIISQELTPKLCSCKIIDEKKTEILRKEFNDDKLVIYKRNPDGCVLCNQRNIKGIKGVSVIYGLCRFKPKYSGNYSDFENSIIYSTTKSDIAKQKMLEGIIDYNTYKSYKNI